MTDQQIPSSTPTEGLPLQPGQPVDEQIASGLVGQGAVEQLQPLQPEAAQQEIDQMSKDAMPDLATHTKRVIPEAPKLAAPPSPLVNLTSPAVEADPHAKSRTLEPVNAGPAVFEVQKQLDVLCPKCGHNVAQPLLFEPTVEDKRTFVRALLTGERFFKRFPLFENKFVVWYRTRLVRENEDVVAAAQANKAVLANPQMFQAELTRYNLVMSLAKLEMYGENGELTAETVYPEVTDETYPPKNEDDFGFSVWRAHSNLFGRMNDVLYAALFRAYIEFTAVIDVMLKRSEDSDFWKATPSPS